jgi:hypothetical protein
MVPDYHLGLDIIVYICTQLQEKIPMGIYKCSRLLLSQEDIKYD